MGADFATFKQNPILMKAVKFLIILVVASTWSGTLNAQSMLQGEPDRDIARQAADAVELWEEELALSAKQMDLMRRKLVEFAIKKRDVLQGQLPAEEKSRILVRLQILQNKDMRDILTGPQFDRYLLLLDRDVRARQAELMQTEVGDPDPEEVD